MKKVALLSAVVSLAGVLSGVAADDSAKILQAADNARGDKSGVSFTVAVADKGSSDTLTVQSKQSDFLAVYVTPAQSAGKKLLMKELNMWFKDPNATKAVPISPRQRLLGGASYGDIASTGWSINYTVKGQEDLTVDGKACIVFQLKAKSSKCAYDNIKLTVDKASSQALKADYESVNNKVLKTATFEYANKLTAHAFISKMTIMEGAAATTLTYTEIKAGEVNNGIFSPDAL